MKISDEYRARVIELDYRRIIEDLRGAQMYGEPVDLENPKEVAVAVYLRANTYLYYPLQELHKEEEG